METMRAIVAFIRKVDLGVIEITSGESKSSPIKSSRIVESNKMMLYSRT